MQSNLGARGPIFITILNYKGKGLTPRREGCREEERRNIHRKEQYFFLDSKQLPNNPQKQRFESVCGKLRELLVLKELLVLFKLHLMLA